MQYCNGSGTCLTNKKPNGQACTASTDCGSGYCVDGICCSGTCTGTCQSCAVAGSLGSCVNLPAGGAGHDGDHAVHAARRIATRPGRARRASSPTAACARRRPSADRASASTASAATDLHRGVLHLQPPRRHAAVSAWAATGAMDRLRGRQLLRRRAQVHQRQEAERRDVRRRHRVRVQRVRRRHLLRERVHGQVPELQERDGHLRVRRPTAPTRARTARGAGTAPGRATGRGRAAGRRRGRRARRPAARATAHPEAASATAPATASRRRRRDCMGFACYTDTATHGEVQDRCFNDPDCAQKRYCADPRRRRGRRRWRHRRRRPGRSARRRSSSGHACTRNTQCLSGTCSDGVCCNVNCGKCGSCNTPGTEGTCIPIAAGTDPENECMDSASDPTRHVQGLLRRPGALHLSRPRARPAAPARPATASACATSSPTTTRRAGRSSATGSTRAASTTTT